MLKSNVEIKNGHFEVTEDLKVGSLLLHADFPLGVAMRDMKKDDKISLSEIAIIYGVFNNGPT